MANEIELQDHIEALRLQMSRRWIATVLAFQAVSAVFALVHPDLRGTLADAMKHQIGEAADHPGVAEDLRMLRDALRGSAPAPAGPTRAH